MVTGADIDYNGQPAGYTLDPEENIVYISAHDNETIFDAIQLKAPLSASAEDRTRMQNLGLSIVAFAQGIPFFHAGDDILRSKSMDRNSYNSGDWFNALDWTYQSNNWGHGLPPVGENGERWNIMQPLLANEDLPVANDQILFANAIYREWLQIRRSSPLFRLRTADDIMQRLQFHNTGADQIPGVILMSITDTEGENLDPNYTVIVVVFNATDREQSPSVEDFADAAFALHPIQHQSADAVVHDANFSDGIFTVPARTTAVFVLPE
jgi:pullulanase/glycogen debranching enzyme